MKHPRFLLAGLILATTLVTGGCTGALLQPSANARQNTREQTDIQLSQQACAYATFLQGIHAERDHELNEALLAYKRTLACDPEVQLVKNKLPALLFNIGKKEEAIQRLIKTIAENPNDIDSRLFLARLYIHNNNHDQAIEIYRQVLHLDPESETALLSLGYLYSQQKQLREAITLFQEVLSRTPDSYFAHLYLARLHSQNDNPEQAAIWYEKTLKLNWSAELAYEIIDFYEKTDNYTRIEKIYRELNWDDPEDERAVFGLIQTLLVRGGEEKALAELDKLRKTSPDPTSIDLLSSRLLIRSNKEGQAIQVLNHILSREESDEAHYTLAIIYRSQQKPAEALHHLQQINPADNKYEDGIYLQVAILSENKKRPEALALLKELTMDSSTASPGLFGLLASLYIDQEQLEEASKVLNLALRHYSDNSILHFSLGVLLNRMELEDEALAAMEQVLRYDPDHAEALNYIGYTWADRNINLGQALDYILRAIELQPNSGYIRDSLGWVYFRMGNLDQARSELEKALLLTTDDHHIHEHLGDVLNELHDTTGAAESYRRSLELLDDEDKKKRLQDKIDAL